MCSESEVRWSKWALLLGPSEFSTNLFPCFEALTFAPENEDTTWEIVQVVENVLVVPLL